MLSNLSTAQRAALTALEAEHGLADYICGGAPKPAVFADFNAHADGFRSFRITRDGTVEDVTASLLETGSEH